MVCHQNRHNMTDCIASRQRRTKTKQRFVSEAHPNLVKTLTKDLADLVIDYICCYCQGDVVWSFYNDPVIGASELRRAEVKGYDRIHSLYLLSWLDSFGDEDDFERTSDYIFPCGEDQTIAVGDVVWAEHEFGPCRMFEAKVSSITGDFATIEPLDKTNCFGKSNTRLIQRLMKVEPPPQLYKGDICWAERSGPMGTYSQIFRAKILGFSDKKQQYTVKWLDSFGLEFPNSKVSSFQVMPYISQPTSKYAVGARALGLTFNGLKVQGIIINAHTKNGLYQLKFNNNCIEYRTLDLLRSWEYRN